MATLSQGKASRRYYLKHKKEICERKRLNRLWKEKNTIEKLQEEIKELKAKLKSK